MSTTLVNALKITLLKLLDFYKTFKYQQLYFVNFRTLRSFKSYGTILAPNRSTSARVDAANLTARRAAAHRRMLIQCNVGKRIVGKCAQLKAMLLTRNCIQIVTNYYVYYDIDYLKDI